MADDRSLLNRPDFDPNIDLDKVAELDVDSIIALLEGKQQQVEADDKGSEPETGQNNTDEQNPASVDDPVFELTVSSDKLYAYVKVKIDIPEREITKQDILNFLKQNHVTYGICEQEIEDFCRKKEYYRELIAAKGKPPVHGQDGKIEYKFSKRVELQPTVREDGSVDYKELGFVQNVSKGDVLCELIPPTEGEPGIDVYGNPIPNQSGSAPEFPPGENTIVSEDGTKLLAAIDGCIVTSSHTVSVKEIFVLDGDVDASSGNIDFIGTVKINGDVREGFTVKAGQDVIVKGVVEGAFIEAGRDIIISEGVNAMGVGRLYANGNVVSAFIENANVECGGDITANVIMNSNVKAEGSINLKGIRGSIVGGSCTAGKSIFAKNIGTERYTPTNVSIQSPILNELLLTGESIHQYNNNMRIINELSGELDKASEYIKKLENQPALSEKQELILRALTTKYNDLTKKLDEAQQKLEESKKELIRLQDFKIVAVKNMYPGTKISIGCFYKIVDNTEQGVKFYADVNGITKSPLSIAEKF